MIELKRSKIEEILTPTTKAWRGIEITPNTQARRNQLRINGMDDFASFSWRGVNAFDTFGAFIINKNSIKFYNGPTYSNSYTKPQFDSAYGQLTGVTFNIQKLDFTIGVYWISEEHYRRLIYWLNPYEINTLMFDFEPNYYYQVKLASVDDGVRYVLGKENGEYMYYTEMKLSFEVQGPACAYYAREYEFNKSAGTPHQEEESTQTYYIQNTYGFVNNSDTVKSELPTPVEAIITGALWGNQQSFEPFYNISLEAQYGDNEPINLFDITFKNQTFSAANPNRLTIKYESETGLLLLDVGDSEYVLLNQLTTSNYGKRIVDSIVVNHFEIPGIFDDVNFNIYNLLFKVTIRSNATANTTLINQWIDSAHFNIRARTNLA